VEAKAAVPDLIATLKDENSNVRRGAVEALGLIGAEATEAVPALIAALKDEDTYVRQSVVDAFRGFDSGVEEAVPALIVALKDEDEYVRFHATLALDHIVRLLYAAAETPEQLGTTGEVARTIKQALEANDYWFTTDLVDRVLFEIEERLGIHRR